MFEEILRGCGELFVGRRNAEAVDERRRLDAGVCVAVAGEC